MELGALVHAVTSTCDARHDLVMVICLEDDDGQSAEVLGFPTAGFDMGIASNELRGSVSGRHERIGFATRTEWAPTPTDDLAPAWLAIVVCRTDQPIFLVTRIVEDSSWYRLAPEDAPEFAVVTARALTGVLDGKPFPDLHFGLGPSQDDLAAHRDVPKESNERRGLFGKRRRSNTGG